jgi:predicted transposase/invertase (TIGR01784 family)
MTSSRFCDPKRDLVFKRIFGTEKNKEITIHLLNDLLGDHLATPVKEIWYENPHQMPQAEMAKESIVDVLCRDQEGREFIIEMQLAKTTDFGNRIIYYSSKSYTARLAQAEPYRALKEVFLLAILDFVQFPYKSNYVCDHGIVDLETLERDFRHFHWRLVELPKFEKKINELETIVDRWIYFFRHAANTDPADVKRIAGRFAIIAKIFKRADMAKFTLEEQFAIDLAIMKERDERDVRLVELETARDEGVAQGKAEGKAEGREEGILQVAKALLDQGMALDQIAMVTGLTADKINSAIFGETVAFAAAASEVSTLLPNAPRKKPDVGLRP